MANVDKGINAVIDILKEEHGYYKDLVELSKSKKNIIIEGKVAELDKMVKLEQNMIFNIGQLEKKREEEREKRRKREEREKRREEERERGRKRERDEERERER